jgi:hypothetical protein
MVDSVVIVHAAIVGGQKAGTTSLYQYLAQHPELATHGQREMSYFVNEHEFQAGPEAAERKYFPDAGARRRLAKHVMLMGSESGMAHFAAQNPEARLIVVLREPIARAYSAYWYARRRGWEDARSFENALNLEAQRLATDGWERWRNCAYVANGRYAEALARIDRHFPASHTLLLFDEELRTDPRRCIHRCCAHLGIADLSATIDVDRIHNIAAQPRSALLARGLAKLFGSRGALRSALRRLIPNRAAYRLRHALLALNERPLEVPPMAPETTALLREAFRASNATLRTRVGSLPEGWFT